MSLDGTWYSARGSQMQLSIGADRTTLSGTYRTPVGLASASYPLIGYCDPNPDAVSTALGFTVVWNNASGDSNSVTTWCGQFQTIDGCEKITALWLLTQETCPGENWKSTLVGEDHFLRQPEEHRHARAHGPRPATFPRAGLS